MNIIVVSEFAKKKYEKMQQEKAHGWKRSDKLPVTALIP
jgi:hypothetical protein